MQRISFLVALAGHLLLIGCEHKPATGESIPEVCQLQNDGKLKAVSGYITTSELTKSCTTTCMLKLRASRISDDPEVDVQFTLGSDNNQLEELPPEFGPGDIRIRDHEGKEIRGGKVVRISGRMSVNRNDGKFGCSMVVGKVEGI